MKIFFKTLMLAIMGLLISGSVIAQSATPTYFIPVSVPKSTPWRIFTAVDTSTLFFNAQQPSSYNGVYLSNLQLELGLVYAIAQDLDVGVGVHGLFFFNPALDFGPMFGIDGMVRYLRKWNDVVYAGIQAQVGYNYSGWATGSGTWNMGSGVQFNIPGQGIIGNSSIPIQAGVVLGAQIKEAVAFYLFPAIELGQNFTVYQEQVLDFNSLPVWKNAVGIQLGTGMVVNVGATKLFLQVRPRIMDVQNGKTWGLDAGLGAYWDL